MLETGDGALALGGAVGLIGGRRGRFLDGELSMLFGIVWKDVFGDGDDVLAQARISPALCRE